MKKTKLKYVLKIILVLLLISVPIQVAVSSTNFSHISFSEHSADVSVSMHHNIALTDVQNDHHKGSAHQSDETCDDTCANCVFCSSIAINSILVLNQDYFSFAPLSKELALYKVESKQDIKPPIFS